MINALFGAVSAVNAAGTVSAVTANNIANSRSNSFKSDYVRLSEQSAGGTVVSSIGKNSSDGYLIPTGNPSDIAILGNGTQEDLENVYSYSAGRFSIDDFGNFRGPAGELLFTGAGGNVSLDNEGNLYKDGNIIGNITANNQNAELPTGYSILSGYMVSSNVNLADEMVTGIVNQRFFEANILTIKTVDEMLGTTVNLKV